MQGAFNSAKIIDTRMGEKASMKQIPFSGMMCHPTEITKDGDFKIKALLSPINRHPEIPPIVRYEHFPCIAERDKRYDMLLNLLKEGR